MCCKFIQSVSGVTPDTENIRVAEAFSGLLAEIRWWGTFPQKPGKPSWLRQFVLILPVLQRA